MPVKRRVAKVRRQDLMELTREQRRTLLHGKGFFPQPAFQSDDDFAAAWEIHRAKLLPEWIAAHPGTRPAAWWKLESSVPIPADEDETDYLRRMNLLSPEEVAAVEAEESCQ